MAESKCKGCGKKIVWAKDENGTKHPLDLVAPVYQITSPELPENEDMPLCRRAQATYVSHFATCSQANLFGKGRKD